MPTNLNKYLTNPNLNEKTKNWINVNLNNYLNKKNNNEDQTEIEHIIDYLNSDDAPKRIKYMSYDEAKAGATKWTEKLRKKAGNIVETEDSVELFMDFFDEGFKIVVLKDKSAYEREGNLMRHCVSSYYGSSDSNIYSLRDSNNNPHCTIEVTKRDGEIHQIKGKGNGPIHPKYIKYVLAFLEKKNIPVRDSELSNLGYTYFEQEEWKILENMFTNIKYLMFQNKKYFYNYCNVKRNERGK